MSIDFQTQWKIIIVLLTLKLLIWLYYLASINQAIRLADFGSKICTTCNYLQCHLTHLTILRLHNVICISCKFSDHVKQHFVPWSAMVNHFCKGTNNAVFQILHSQECDFLYILHGKSCVPQTNCPLKTHDQATDCMINLPIQIVKTRKR